MLLSILQIIVSIALILLILLQERSSGAGGLFGGGEASFYQRRRGIEQIVFYATIALVALFGILSIASLLFQAS